MYCKLLSVSKYQWYKRNKTVWYALLLETNQLHGVNNNTASCRIASHHPVTDYFPITEGPVMLYSLVNK